VPDANTSVGQENLENTVIPKSPECVTIPEIEKSPDKLLNLLNDNEENWSEERTVAISQADESMNTVSENLEDDVSA
ncbi:hypothetical protein A2U01_0097867, partial [Trifolium medium]|nr:hypothetical protein [Trifolium medium]